MKRGPRRLAATLVWMAEKSGLAQWVALLGQVFLRPKVAELILPEEEAPEPLAPLIGEIRRAQADPTAAEIEYTRLFLNPQGAPCPPWQSANSAAVGDLPRLFGPAHHSALEWYRRYGAEPADETEPADHIGLLLVFYARLLLVGEESETVAAFVDEHLSWAPAYLEKLSTEARHPLYRVLADVSRSIV